LEPPLSWQIDPEQYLFIVWVAGDSQGQEPEPFTVTISDTQSKVAGFGEGPTAAWLKEQFVLQVSRRLVNDRPVLEQMRGGTCR
jgi:hypothetical protein